MDNNVKKIVELTKDNRRIGFITLFEDDSVGVCLKDKCYVTKPGQKEIFYIAQAWYTSLFPGLKVVKDEELRVEEGEEPSEIILLTDEKCPSCIAVKEFLREEIESGKIKVVDMESEEGKELCDMLNVNEAPIIIVKYYSDEGEIFHRCKISTEGDDLKITCDEEGFVKKKVE